MNQEKNIGTISLDGGCLCFDFINTVDDRLTGQRIDYLTHYEDILTLAERLEILPPSALTTLGRYATQHRAEATNTLDHYSRVRENLFHFFYSIAQRKPIKPEVLQKFNQDLAMVFSHLQFSTLGGSLQYVWNTSHHDLYLPLRMALKSAFDILTNYSPSRIKACPSCAWIFLDASKNNTRRWCDMQSCGSVDKAKRYYHRKKQMA